MKASFLLCRITMPITCERRANTNTRDYSGDFWTFSSRKSTKSHVCLFFCFFFIPSSFFLKKKTKNKTAECAGCLISHTDTNVFFFLKFEPKKKKKRACDGLVVQEAGEEAADRWADRADGGWQAVGGAGAEGAAVRLHVLRRPAQVHHRDAQRPRLLHLLRHPV